MSDAAPIRIVFFGNSLTAAYGLEPEQGFVALLEKRIREAGYQAGVLNAGLSGETTAGGLRRIRYILEEPLDILVLELGINDAYEGESPALIKDNLQKIIDQTLETWPQTQILLLGVKPPEDFSFPQPKAFFQIYEELARENQLPLVPDLIAKTRKRPQKYFFDGIHPNAEGHRLLAKTVWRELKNVIGNH